MVELQNDSNDLNDRLAAKLELFSQIGNNSQYHDQSNTHIKNFIRFDTFDFTKLSFKNKGYTYTNPLYVDDFFTALYSLFKTQKLCDVTLICGDKSELASIREEASVSIQCHKVVLASFSNYFKAMFSSNLIETQTNRVYLPNVEINALNAVITYAYSGSISFNTSNVQSIFLIASLLDLKQIIDAASDYMESQLDTNNALEIYVFARQHMCEYLEEKSQDFINRYFVDIVKTNEFFQFNDVNMLVDLFSSDDLDVANEESLFVTILDWIEHDYASRCGYFELLFKKCVRLSLIEPARVSEIFIKYQSIIFQSEACVTMIRCYIEGKSVHSDQSLKKATKRSGMLKAEQCFILIGGNCDNDEGCYVNCFNPFNGDKYFLSKNFLEKSAFQSKGYFHIENPGNILNKKDMVLNI
jgi:hypothetical protein